MTIRPAIAAHWLRSPWAVLTAFTCTAALGQGCTAHIEGDGGPGSQAATPGGSGAGPGPVDTPAPSAAGDIRGLTPLASARAGALGLRGLTRLEYDNTVSAALGEPVTLAAKWGEEIRDSGGFASARPISASEVQDYFEAAESAAARVKAGFSRLWSCAAGQTEATCAEQFIGRFGRASFRRPILEAERSSYLALFNTARTTHSLGLEDAVALVSEAILQSPSFMYHWELGPQRPLMAGDGNVALTAHELAARLSYFFTQAPPDAALAADADSGKLLDRDTLQSHAERLLAGTTTAGLFRALVGKMLNLGSEIAAPGSLDADLLDSRQRFIDHTLAGADGNIQRLLLGEQYYVNEQLAPLYGVTGISGSDLRLTAVNPSQRLGILTHADYLKYTGKEDDSMPPRRGLKLLTEFLCQETPPMPAIPPEIQREDGQTQREFFEDLVEQQPCAKACHGTLDPLGFAFEHYGGSDWRETDQKTGKTIDASGAVTLPFGELVPYAGAPELIRAIAQSEEYRQCMTRQVFRMATGRAESGYDVATLQHALEAQRAAGDDLRVTLAAVAASDAFRLRSLNEGEMAR